MPTLIFLFYTLTTQVKKEGDPCLRIPFLKHWRCQAESNCCTWFCRPLPNHSAIAPCQTINKPSQKDCKYRPFFRESKIFQECSGKKSRKNREKIAKIPHDGPDTLLHVQEQPLQVLPFRMVDVHRMVGRLVQPVKDAHTAPCLGGRREDRKGERLLVHHL